MEEEELVWIEDATKEFSRSRKFFEALIRAKKLTAVEIPGSTRVYLIRAEVVEALKPRPRASKSKE